jgi:hypothetical protein
MIDRISVRSFPVSVTPVAGNAQTKLLARFDVMEREAAQATRSPTVS